MDSAFAFNVADMIVADIYRAAPPFVCKALPDGRVLSFTDELIGLFREEMLDFEDAVPLDSLEDKEDAARKLAAWLGLLLGGPSGVTEFESGYSVWATREDGYVLEVGPFGYQLYDSKEGSTRVGSV